jgi:protein required for attachment to host cells
LAQQNFQYEKRQKDLAKKKKQDEKRQRKLDKGKTPSDENPDSIQIEAESVDVEKTE